MSETEDKNSQKIRKAIEAVEDTADRAAKAATEKYRFPTATSENLLAHAHSFGLNTITEYQLAGKYGDVKGSPHWEMGRNSQVAKDYSDAHLRHARELAESFDAIRTRLQKKGVKAEGIDKELLAYSTAHADVLHETSNYLGMQRAIAWAKSPDFKERMKGRITGKATRIERDAPERSEFKSKEEMENYLRNLVAGYENSRDHYADRMKEALKKRSQLAERLLGTGEKAPTGRTSPPPADMAAALDQWSRLEGELFDTSSRGPLKGSPPLQPATRSPSGKRR